MQKQTVFLSHLPLFDSPHDYQVILEATFSKPGSNPQSVYFNDRKRTGEKVYTLQPKAFVLPRLAAGQPLRSFRANVFRGQYELMKPREQDAARIGQDVEVKVTKFIHFRKFDPAAAKVAQLEYLLFGKGGYRGCRQEVCNSALYRRPRRGYRKGRRGDSHHPDATASQAGRAGDACAQTCADRDPDRRQRRGLGGLVSNPEGNRSRRHGRACAPVQSESGYRKAA